MFLAAKKKYRQTLYRIKNFTQENKLNKLADLEKKDPKTFWKGVKQLVKDKSTEPVNISHQQWTNHFRHLLNSAPIGRDEQFFE